MRDLRSHSIPTKLRWIIALTIDLVSYPHAAGLAHLKVGAKLMSLAKIMPDDEDGTRGKR